MSYKQTDTTKGLQIAVSLLPFFKSEETARLFSPQWKNI